MTPADGNWEKAEASYRKALAFAVDGDLLGRATDEVIGVAMAMAVAGRARDAIRIAAVARAKQVELHSLGTDAYADALAEHRRLLRDAFARHGSVCRRQRRRDSLAQQALELDRETRSG